MVILDQFIYWDDHEEETLDDLLARGSDIEEIMSWSMIHFMRWW
jgi:hypothetical protein